MIATPVSWRDALRIGWAWALLAALAIGAVLASGCAGIPGDGRLVRVELGEGFTAAHREGFERGVRYWDAAGARLRLEGDGLPTGEPVVAVLRFEASGIPLAEMAWYDVATNAIRFDMGKIGHLSPKQAATLAAHETGHALGLQHHDGANLMDPEPWPMTGPSSDDLAQYRSVWGAR